MIRPYLTDLKAYYRMLEEKEGEKMPDGEEYSYKLILLAGIADELHEMNNHLANLERLERRR